MSVKTNKILYFDVETGGLKPNENPLLQLAMIVEIDGEVKEEVEWNIQPRKNDIIDDKALEINGLKKEDFPSFIPPDRVLREIQTVLGKYVNKYDKKDKFVTAGYNVDFDTRFLRSFFFRGNDKFFYSYFHKIKIDPMKDMEEAYHTGAIDTINYKLTTVCKYFDIKLDDAHTALADIRATRELIKLRKTQPE